MMNVPPMLSAAPPKRFQFVGGALCLDFCNSVGGKRETLARENLQSQSSADARVCALMFPPLKGARSPKRGPHRASCRWNFSEQNSGVGCLLDYNSGS